jgi:hypothetical protein
MLRLEGFLRQFENPGKRYLVQLNPAKFSL